MIANKNRNHKNKIDTLSDRECLSMVGDIK